LSNQIIYRANVREDADNPKREINSNNLLEKKLSNLKMRQESELRERLQLDGEAGEEQFDSNGDPIFVEQPLNGEAPADFVSPEELERLEAQAQERADEIIAHANAEAESILENANREAEATKSNAFQHGKEEGYQAGLFQTQEELVRAKEDFENQVNSLKEELATERQNLEKEVVDVVLEVIDKVFHCQLDGKKDIVFNLCKDALKSADDSKELLIRVAKDSVNEFQTRLPELQESARENVSISVTEDPLLSGDQCMIETDSGIIDCSLGVEFDNLIRDIKSLI
jgi:flagellar assembly protein FliH